MGECCCCVLCDHGSLVQHPSINQLTLLLIVLLLNQCAAVQQKQGSLWLASNPSKRWAEVFFLAYSPFWILWALCILVPFQLYEVGVWRCKSFEI